MTFLPYFFFLCHQLYCEKIALLTTTIYFKQFAQFAQFAHYHCIIVMYICALCDSLYSYNNST